MGTDGICACGCGQTTSVWKRSQRSLGRVKGEHSEYVNGHRKRTRNVVDGKLRCGDCGEWKPLADFYSNPNGGHLGKAHYCKPCQNARSRWSHIRIRYGVTKAQYEEILGRQGGVCAICKEPPTKLLGVDHCHDSMQVRGLLCDNCNSGIGRLGDNAGRVRRALAYLEGA